MKRRTFVAATTVGAAGLAGCSGILGGSNGPDDAVEEFYGAIDDGDADAANDLIHPDSEEEEVTQEELDELEEMNFSVSVENTEILEEDDEKAVVETELRTQGELFGEEIDETETFEIELRTDDGEWKVYGLN